MPALPQSVRKQVDAANAALEQLQQQQAPAPETGVSLEQLAAQPTNHEPTPATPAQPQSEAPTATVPSQDPPAQPAAPQQDPWEARYKSLQGIFNSQVPQLQRENATLKRELDELKSTVKELSSARVNEPAPETKLNLDKDVENFGADLVGMVQRVVTSVVGNLAPRMEGVVAQYGARLDALEQALKGTTEVVTVTAEQAFFNRLAQAVPDWSAINSDPRFLSWLGEIDPVYGVPRQTALDAAQQRLQADQAIAIFNAFKATLPQAPKPDALDRQLTPNTSAATPPQQPNKPILTQQQVAKFYDDRRRGMYRGREEEAGRIEAMINLAIEEGRVR